MKKVTKFFPLYPAPFYGRGYEKQKRPELVICLFELQNMFTKILVWPFKSGKWKKKEKKNKTLNISRTKSAC